MAPLNSFLLIGLLLLVFGCRLVASQQTTPQPPCEIPAGHYDNEPIAFYEQEPRGGDICNGNGTTQRMFKRCMTRYCCEAGCNCNSDGLFEGFQPNCTKLSCYVQVRDIDAPRLICCSGTVFVLATRNCVAMDKCANNSLGCEYQCVQSSDHKTATCSCPTGYQLDTANNRTCTDVDECSAASNPCSDFCNNFLGGFRCSCHANRQLTGDGHTCQDIPVGQSMAVSTSPETPAGAPVHGSSTRSPAAFPYPYIVAIVVGSLLLLLLLLLLLFCCIRHRRRRQLVAAAFDNDTYGTTTVIPVVADEKKKSKMDDGEITIVADDSLKPNRGKTVTLYDTVGDSTSTEDRTGDMGSRAREAALLSASGNAALASRRAEPNPYVTLPRSAAAARNANGAPGRAGASTTVVEGEYAEINDVISERL